MSTSSRTIRTGLLGLCLATAAAAAHAAPTPALERIKGAGSMTIGYVDGTPPFSSMGGQAQPVGYSIDLCKHVVDAVKAKMPWRPYQYIPWMSVGMRPPKLAGTSSIGTYVL